MVKYLVFHPRLNMYGGAEKVSHNVIKTLVAHAQHVEVITFNFNREEYGEIMGEQMPREVIVHSIEKKDERPPFTIYKRHHNTAKLLKRFRKELTYDFFFSTQSSSPFEPVFLNKAKMNIAYVHFPEIHFEYAHASLRRKAYMWLFRRWIEAGIKKLDLVFCNSTYSKEVIEQYWGPLGIQNPIVIHPPVNLESFWCEGPPSERRKRVVYIGRFVPVKRHELLKKLATELPDYDFVSIGGLIESDKDWYTQFSKSVPSNYSLRPNLPFADMVEILQQSRVYVHLMEGEHFGIAPMEAMAAGCITLVHNSGGVKEFVPNNYRWESYDDLKEKVIAYLNASEESLGWEKTRQEIWRKLSNLEPKVFQEKIWAHVKPLTNQT
jgi:glycosyltransferase involved in cell wall biosynthesis